MTTDIVHRILVVHPSDTPRQLLVYQLKSVGYRYVAAVTGARPALDILDHSRVDLVVAADKLDDMDVWAFVRTIRSGNLCPAIIPMIVVAANRVSVGSDTIAEDLGVQVYRGEQDGPLETVIEPCSRISLVTTHSSLKLDATSDTGRVHRTRHERTAHYCLRAPLHSRPPSNLSFSELNIFKASFT